MTASRQFFGNRCNSGSQIVTPCDQSSGSHRKSEVTRIARRTDLQLDFDASVKQSSGILQIYQDGFRLLSQPFQRANRRQALAFLDGPHSWMARCLAAARADLSSFGV